MRNMSWRELDGRPWRIPYTCKREAVASQSSRLSPSEEPMLGSQNSRDLETSSALLAFDFLSPPPQPRDFSCFSRQLMSTSNCTLVPNRTSPLNSIPPSHWTPQQRVEFNWLIYQDLCARRLYYNQLHSSATLSAMREVGDTTSEGFMRLAAEQDMELSENVRPIEEESLLISQETNKCSVPGVPAALSKHREQLGLPTETSKLLKDILQHKDRALRENNNSLKGLMVTGREGQDNTDLIAHLMKNNSSHSHTALMDERDSLRVSVHGDSESDSDRDSYTDTCRFNGDEELGETDTMDSDIKDENIGEKRNSDHFDQDGNGQAVKDGDSVEAKRARVENIITSMRPSPSGIGADMGAQLSPDMRRPKRKQYQPQQHDSKYAPHSANKYRKQEERNKLKEQLHFVQKTLQQMQKQYMDLFDEEEKDSADFSLRANKDSKYLDILSDKICSKKEDSTLCRNLNFSSTSLDASSLLKESSSSELSPDISTSSRNTQNLDKDGLKDFASMLKFEIADAVGSAIDGVVTKFLSPVTKPKRTDSQNTVNSQNVEKENKPLRVSPRPSESVSKMPEFAENNHKECQSSSKPLKTAERSDFLEKQDRFDHKTSFLDSPLRGFMDMPRTHHSMPQLPPYPGMPFYMPAQIHAPTPMIFGVEPEQTEALPLVVNTPKKKRTKVTDTRLSPRAARVLLQETVPVSSHSDLTMGRSSPSAYPHLFPHLLPTSVAIPNPGLQHSDIMRFYEEQVYNHHHDTTPQSSTHSPLHADQGSPGASHISASEGAHLSNGKRERDSYSPGDASYDSYHLTSTLTPMHLRKAKLMFFFVRYPSSAILKMYFPDIKFNKNNTAQLVKWFSNFREFYYIQMEKYSRQAIAEGVKNAEDLIVTTDSELYRILNLHYNRNNQLEVPESFRMVVQATLREFFKSIYTGKDQEQSWKKAIYKVIARMDDILPEYFKSPNWMEQLGEM